MPTEAEEVRREATLAFRLSSRAFWPARPVLHVEACSARLRRRDELSVTAVAVRARRAALDSVARSSVASTRLCCVVRVPERLANRALWAADPACAWKMAVMPSSACVWKALACGPHRSASCACLRSHQRGERAEQFRAEHCGVALLAATELDAAVRLQEASGDYSAARVGLQDKVGASSAGE